MYLLRVWGLEKKRTLGKGTHLFPFLPCLHHFSPDYQHDPYAEHNPCNTICCREDLNPSFPVPAGCYDSKVNNPNFCLCQMFAAVSLCSSHTCGVFSCIGVGMARPASSLHSVPVLLLTLTPVLVHWCCRGCTGKYTEECCPWEPVLFRG